MLEINNSVKVQIHTLRAASINAFITLLPHFLMLFVFMSKSLQFEPAFGKIHLSLVYSSWVLIFVLTVLLCR